jgi:hypothetical protein
MSTPPPTKPPDILDKIVDVVLAHKPKQKKKVKSISTAKKKPSQKSKVMRQQ